MNADLKVKEMSNFIRQDKQLINSDRCSKKWIEYGSRVVAFTYMDMWRIMRGDEDD